jgi:hypothetical protein
MSAPFYDASIPPFYAALESLTSILTKASTTKEESLEKLLEARLAPDMFPLAFQVFFTCDVTAKVVARVLGNEPAQLGAHTDLKTFDDCKQLIQKARDLLDSIDKEQYNSRMDTVIEFGLGPGKSGKMASKGYVASYALPNMMFHLVTAYGILRKEGVELGKMDYILPFGISKAEIIETK